MHALPCVLHFVTGTRDSSQIGAKTERESKKLSKTRFCVQGSGPHHRSLARTASPARTLGVRPVPLHCRSFPESWFSGKLQAIHESGPHHRSPARTKIFWNSRGSVLIARFGGILVILAYFRPKSDLSSFERRFWGRIGGLEAREDLEGLEDKIKRDKSIGSSNLSLLLSFFFSLISFLSLFAISCV